MDFNRNIFAEEHFRGEINRIPQWAKAEQLEMNVPQKELWHYSEETPAFSGRRMSAICRLAALALFVAATFLIAEDSILLDAVAFLGAACLLTAGESYDGRGKAEKTQHQPAAVRQRRSRRGSSAHMSSAH